MKLKAFAGGVAIAALAATGAGLATAGTAAAAEEAKPNLGPYDCMLSLPLLAEEDPLLVGGLMCKGPIEAEVPTDEVPTDEQTPEGPGLPV
jgi:hypothetical protein